MAPNRTPDVVMSPELELLVHRFVEDVTQQLEHVGSVNRLVRAVTRDVRGFFGADAAAAFQVLPSGEPPRPLFVIPQSMSWDLRLIERFHANPREPLPPDTLLGSLHRRDRPWAVLGVRARHQVIDTGEQIAMSQIARHVSQLIHAVDVARSTEVRERIDRKIMEQLRPKDLFYQILDGLRSLTRYDHSSALYMTSEGGFELVAEKIAWSKGKSRRIGHLLSISPDLREQLAFTDARNGTHVEGFSLEDDTWRSWTGTGAALAAELDSHRDGSPPGPRERSMICAPLVTRHEVLGVLKIAGLHPGSFGAYEIDLLRSFVPDAIIALRNAQRAESLELRIFEAEKREALATLARSVSHDVNNAVGAALPLTQQIREDLAQGRVDPGLLAEDLMQIEQALKFCRRVFGGMLSFARGAAQTVGEASVARATESMLSVLSDSLKRQRIRTELAIADDTPSVRSNPGDLQQLLLNLATNARDAMPHGGTLHIAADVGELDVTIRLRDTGPGIDREVLARVFEPFFTTKPTGSGLGLPTCQTIVWRVRGDIQLDSKPGLGTTVSVRLPRADRRDPVTDEDE